MTVFSCEICLKYVGEGVALRTLDLYGKVLCTTCGTLAGVAERDTREAELLASMEVE